MPSVRALAQKESRGGLMAPAASASVSYLCPRTAPPAKQGSSRKSCDQNEQTGSRISGLNRCCLGGRRRSDRVRRGPVGDHVDPPGDITCEEVVRLRAVGVVH